MSKSKKEFRMLAIIEAQRRVLDMVAYQIEKMPKGRRCALRVDRDTGLTTWAEILEHVNAARSYSVEGIR